MDRHKHPSNPLKPTLAAPRTHSDTHETETQLLMSDFGTMRNQVYALMAFEVQMVNFALTFLGVLVAALTQSSVLALISAKPRLLLYVSGVFLLFGTMHVYEKFRIFQTVAYIENFISPRLAALIGRPPLHQWEHFLSYCYSEIRMVSVLALLRTALFAVPPVFLIGYFLVLKKNVFSIIDIAVLLILIACGVVYALAMYRLNIARAQQMAVNFSTVGAHHHD